MSPRLPQSRQTVRQQQDAGTWMAMVLVLSVATGLFGLMWMVMPDLAQMALVGASLPAFIAIHYFTWGRWLNGALRPPVDDSTPAEPPQRIGSGAGTE